MSVIYEALAGGFTPAEAECKARVSVFGSAPSLSLPLLPGTLHLHTGLNRFLAQGKETHFGCRSLNCDVPGPIAPVRDRRSARGTLR